MRHAVGVIRPVELMKLESNLLLTEEGREDGFGYEEYTHAEDAENHAVSDLFLFADAYSSSHSKEPSSGDQDEDDVFRDAEELQNSFVS